MNSFPLLRYLLKELLFPKIFLMGNRNRIHMCLYFKIQYPVFVYKLLEKHILDIQYLYSLLVLRNNWYDN